MRLPRLRLKLWMMLVLVAVVALGIGGQQMRRRRARYLQAAAKHTEEEANARQKIHENTLVLECVEKLVSQSWHEQIVFTEKNVLMLRSGSPTIRR